jgi:hypothetical protein
VANAFRRELRIAGGANERQDRPEAGPAHDGYCVLKLTTLPVAVLFAIVLLTIFQ